MFSLVTKFHIRKRARTLGTSNRRNYRDVQAEIQKVNYSDCRIVFSWLFDFGSNTLNACALLPGIIIFNSEWAAHLMLSRDEETLNAFKATMGHELAHKDNDYVFWEFWTKDKKFVNWVNEVHADFGGAEKSFDLSRENQICALQYKLIYKGKRDKDTAGHPSWKRRLEYVTKHNFNEHLIELIAADTGCKNEKLVNNVKSHFSYIELH